MVVRLNSHFVFVLILLLLVNDLFAHAIQVCLRSNVQLIVYIESLCIADFGTNALDLCKHGIELSLPMLFGGLQLLSQLIILFVFN